MTATDSRQAPAALLEVRGLQKTFTSKKLFASRHEVCAARDVSFRLHHGEAVALVGESGSGKSTIARMLLRLETPDGGEIRLAGKDVLASEPGRASLAYRGRVQMVFQDPFGSLNPVHSVGHHLERPLLRHGSPGHPAPQGERDALRSLNPMQDVGRHLERPLARRASAGSPAGQPARRGGIPREEIRARVLDLLRTVGLDPPEEFISRYPHELSGGQRQRVAIARALAVSPDLLVADEPTSMLDVSIRMGVLNILAGLKRDHGLAILLITHDLASARYLADRILVLYRGRLVEDGPSEEIVASPKHPYTRALLAAIADADGTSAGGAAARSVPGAEAGTGCPFAARCPDRADACLQSDPEPRTLGNRSVRCHLYPAGQPAGQA
jgi:peptide/nickel transport system ATP-binding protein